MLLLLLLPPAAAPRLAASASATACWATFAGLTLRQRLGFDSLADTFNTQQARHTQHVNMTNDVDINVIPALLPVAVLRHSRHLVT